MPHVPQASSCSTDLLSSKITEIKGIVGPDGMSARLAVCWGYTTARSGQEGKDMQRPRLKSTPPISDMITDYDREHFTTYFIILDCAAVRAPWNHAAKQLRDQGMPRDRRKAKAVHDAHLARARWMTEEGWKLLMAERLMTENPSFATHPHQCSARRH